MNTLMHVGILDRKWLFLRRLSPQHFVWFEVQGERTESELPIQALSVEEALRHAHRTWGPEGFRTLICGFRYTLPERDEHGSNALFYQMAASYQSSNGIYFDEELGGNCVVHFASQEARNLLQQLKSNEK